MTSPAIRLPRIRIGLLLWLAGMAGVVAIALLVVPKLMALIPPGQAPPVSPNLLVAAAMAQSAVVLALAVWLGVALAPAVGLRAPAFEAAATKGSVTAALRLQLVPGLVGGVAGAIVLVLFSAFAPSAIAQAHRSLEIVLVARVLYGGITEEILLRWGFMTLLVWLLWRFGQRRMGSPRPVLVWTAILVSAVMFGVGHLPTLGILVPAPTPGLVAYVVAANALFGIVAGYLYWRHGLESAMLAHASAHVLSYLVRG